MDIKSWFPEFNVSAERDADLLKYFFKTSYVDQITSTSKWMVLGRKGTGKTAIYEYLKSTRPSSLCGFHNIPLNFRDYPWPTHKLYKESMEGELVAYQKSWHYLFVIQSISKLIEIREASGNINKELKTAKKLLEQIYGNPTPSIIDVIKSKVARIKSLSLPSADLEEIRFSAGDISFEEIAEDSKLKAKLRANAFSLLSHFERLLLENIGDCKFIVTLDQLDENWLETEIEEYSKILINLINTCQAINHDKKYQKLLKAVIFIRTDIYETLRFNDKNKIYQDSAIEIRWDDDSLDDMFFERIKSYKPKDLALDTNTKSNAIFEVKHVRHGATPFRHILRRSFYRPRDIIVYLNKTREVHKTTKTGLYSSKDIYSAEKNASISIYNEIIDEWANQKPEVEKFLAVLHNIKYQTFKFKDFEKNYEKVFGHDEKSQITEAILFLFNNSIIGQKISANWIYFCVNPYMQVDFGKAFHVNSALKDRLMLTESRTSQS